MCSSGIVSKLCCMVIHEASPKPSCRLARRVVLRLSNISSLTTFPSLVNRFIEFLLHGFSCPSSDNLTFLSLSVIAWSLGMSNGMDRVCYISCPSWPTGAHTLTHGVAEMLQVCDASSPSSKASRSIVDKALNESLLSLFPPKLLPWSRSFGEQRKSLYITSKVHPIW
jgi:hypothetical protein